MGKVAEFFCQDVKKFKLEELFVDILNFLRELENAQKVTILEHCGGGWTYGTREL